MVQDIKVQGKTVFLTTHYMEEAEYLCDRVAIMDSGQIVALDTPANLIADLKINERVIFRTSGDWSADGLANLPRVARVEKQGDKTVVYGRDNGSQNSTPIVTEIVNALTSDGIQFSDLRTEHPDLEDVFLSLTGRKLPEERSE